MNKLNLIKHRKGSYNDYDPDLYHNIIYFAEDQQIIILNGIEYSGSDYVHELKPFIFKIETAPTDRFQLIQNNIRNPIIYEFDFGDEIIEYNSADYNNKIIEYSYKDGEIKPRNIEFNIKSHTDFSELSTSYIFRNIDNNYNNLNDVTKYIVGGINGILYNYIYRLSYDKEDNIEMGILNNVITIYTYAFNHYKGITNINIPDSVTSIDDYVFSGCSSLVDVNMSNSVMSIGNYVFYDCISLTNINISNSVTAIPYSAFRGCSSLIDINISDSVTSIGGSAFYDCISLTKINIPDSVTFIADNVFYGCTALNKVYVCEDTLLNNNWLGDSKPEVIKYKKGEKPWLNEK